MNSIQDKLWGKFQFCVYLQDLARIRWHTDPMRLEVHFIIGRELRDILRQKIRIEHATTHKA